jgi:hypothetical protein
MIIETHTVGMLKEAGLKIEKRGSLACTNEIIIDYKL